MDTVQYAPLTVALLIGVWPPDTATTALILAVAVLIIMLVGLRLRRWTNAEHAARLRAERQAALSEKLQQLVAAVSRARTPARVIEDCVPEFLHAVDGAAAAFIVLGDGGRSGEIVQTVACDEPFTRSPFPLSTYPALGHVAERHAIGSFDAPASLAPGLSGSDRGVPFLDALALQPTAVAIPLVTAGRTIAILVMSFGEARSLAPDERELLLSAGRRTAEALVRAQAHETSEHARVEAEDFRARAALDLRQRQKAEAALRESESKYRALAARTNRLYELSAALSESITVEAVATAIVRHGTIALGASATSVALLSVDRTWFETLYGEEYAEQPAESCGAFAADSGLCATDVIETRQPVFVSSFADCRERYWRSASIAASGGFASAAVLPLIVNDAAIGVLTVHFTAPVHFGHDYTALLVSVAQHCAQAIDRARLYDTAQRARAEAETANRSKDEFLSIVSHELRTPLTAVLGCADMLRAGSLDAARTTRAVEAIFNNAMRQAQLIEELLDISRIVGGRVVFEPRELDLGDTIQGSIEAIMPQADAKGVEVRFGARPSVAVLGDARRLEQVFLNLLANAVKFTPHGGWVTVDVIAGTPTVAVRVTDSGVGIDPVFLPHVFEQFRQGDISTARSKGGLGLGLFIARQLIDAHGGSIRAESAGLDAGTTFIVTLPLLSARAGQGSAPAAGDRRYGGRSTAPSLSGVRVLIVDDEPDVRELMVTALERSGAIVTSVGSAVDALAVLSHADVDVLLADIAMPGQDGYDLIRATRALPSARARRIPAAAVTACARDDERQR
ncbi:MAG TPA: ATP-binding protein, partial [Vicinamibacterales bacterium]|nr:ATP-binding protein [Vicinamibacterales bacterium]